MPDCTGIAQNPEGEGIVVLQVLTVRDILKYGVSDHMGARVDLEELAMKALKYSMAEGFTVSDLNEQVIPAHKVPLSSDDSARATGITACAEPFHEKCAGCTEGPGADGCLDIL